MREADADSKDREKEADELAELKTKIFSGEFENPSLEYEKARREIDKLYEPRILINVNLEAAAAATSATSAGHQRKQAASAAGEGANNGQKQRKLHSSDSYDPEMAGHNDDSLSNDGHGSMADTASNASGYAKNNNNDKSLSSSHPNSLSRQNSESRDSLAHIHTPTQSEREREMLNDQGAGHDAHHLPSATPPMTMPLISLTLGNNLKKKKIEATGVFVNDDDNDENINPKKRKLVPLGGFEISL